MHKLQSMQSMAARMVTGARRCDRITPILDDLHWLPVSQRVVFKTALMVWKCIKGVASAYLSDLCVPVMATSGREKLRSASCRTLLVPHVRTTAEQRILSFAVNGPTTWNNLPPALRTPELSQKAFDHTCTLKTHRFSAFVET